MYLTPVFNVAFDYWSPGTTPATQPVPTNTGVLGQLYLGSKAYLDITPGDNRLWVPPIFIRIATSSLEAIGSTTVGGVFRFVDASFIPRCYLVRWWEYTHYLFSNEYVSLLVEQCNADGSTPASDR